MTAALEGAECSAARPGRTLPLEKLGTPFYRRLGGPQGRSRLAENFVSTGIRSRTVQPVVSRYIYQSVRWLGYVIHDQGIPIRLPAGERDPPVGSRPAIQWALAPLLKSVKQRQRDFDQPPLPTTDVQNERSYTSALTSAFTAWYLNQHRQSFP